MERQLRGIAWDGGEFQFLEQTLLPFREEWVSTADWRVVVDAIQRLAIRGAPAIGVSGAYAVVLAWRESGGGVAFREWADEIRQARPTAVNLAWAVDRMLAVIDGEGGAESNGAKLLEEAEVIAHEDEEMCLAMAKAGLELIGEGARALTHCNTGFLVTHGIGTALGVLRHAHEAGRLEEVYACEARPLGQGSRLTMWELNRLGIPARLLCDSAVGRLMQDGLVDFVMLGADRIAANGDVANKIGTFQLAVLADRFEVPFYVVAPSSTIDSTTPDGAAIPIEYRHPDEVRTCVGNPVTLAGVETYNPAFDVTPAELITAIVHENGVAFPPYRFGLQA